MIDWAELILFLYVTARISGFILFNPILGRSNITAMFRAGMILVLSLFVFFTAGRQTVAVPENLFALMLSMTLEISIGFVLGMAVNFVFYIPQLAGSLIDTQMGMTMNQMYDAGSQANMSTTAMLLNALMTLLFFAANGHHTLLRIFLTSQQIVPFGQVVWNPEAFSYCLELFVQCTLMGVKLCMPILAAELLAQMGMGVLMKVIPQINVFSINIELKVLVGLGLLFVLIAPISEFLLSAERYMLDSLSQLLHQMG